MPLDYRDTPEAFSNNFRELMATGKHSKAQALKIAYETRREARKRKKR